MAKRGPSYLPAGAIALRDTRASKWALGAEFTDHAIRFCVRVSWQSSIFISKAVCSSPHRTGIVTAGGASAKEGGLWESPTGSAGNRMDEKSRFAAALERRRTSAFGESIGRVSGE